MKFKMFSVYDEKAAAFLPPFMLPTAPMAVRAIGDCVTDVNHAFGKNPGDYTLFCLGQWDDATAEWKPLPEAQNLGTCLEIRAKGAIT